MIESIGIWIDRLMGFEPVWVDKNFNAHPMTRNKGEAWEDCRRRYERLYPTR